MKRTIIASLVALAPFAIQATNDFSALYSSSQIEAINSASQHKPSIELDISAEIKGKYGSLLNEVVSQGDYLFSYSKNTSYALLSYFDEQTYSWSKGYDFDIKSLYDENYNSIQISKAAINEDGLIILTGQRYFNDNSEQEVFTSVMSQNKDGTLVLLADNSEALSISKIAISDNLIIFKTNSKLYFKSFDSDTNTLKDIQEIDISSLDIYQVNDIILDSSSKRLFITGEAYSYISNKNKSFIEFKYIATDSDVTLQEIQSNSISETSGWETSTLLFDAKNQKYLLKTDSNVKVYSKNDADQYILTSDWTISDFSTAIGTSYYNLTSSQFINDILYIPSDYGQIKAISITDTVISVTAENNFNLYNSWDSYNLISTYHGLVGLYPEKGVSMFTIENNKGELTSSSISDNTKIENIYFASYIKSLDLWIEIGETKIKYYRLIDQKLSLIDEQNNEELFENQNYNKNVNGYIFEFDQNTNKLFYFAPSWNNDSSYHTAEISLTQSKIDLTTEKHQLEGTYNRLNSFVFSTNTNDLVTWSDNQINFYDITETPKLRVSFLDGISNTDTLSNIQNVFIKDNFIYVVSEGDHALNVFEKVDNGDIKLVNVIKNFDALNDIRQSFLLGDKIILRLGKQVTAFSITKPTEPELLSWSPSRIYLQFLDNHYALEYQYNYSREASLLNLNSETGFLQKTNNIKSLGSLRDLYDSKIFPTSNGLWVSQSTKSYYDKTPGMKGIISLNRAPISLHNNQKLLLNEGQNFSYKLTESFVEYDENDVLSFTSEDITNSFTITDEGQLTFNDNIDSGEGEFNIIATDLSDNTAMVTFEYDINGKPYLFNPLSTMPFEVNDAISIDLSTYFTDEQRENLIYSLEGTLPEGLTLNEAGVISGSISVAGSYDITVNVADNKGAASTTTFSVKITEPTPITPVAEKKESSGGSLLFLTPLLMLLSTRKKLSIK